MRFRRYPMYDLSTIVDISRKARNAGNIITKETFAQLTSKSGQVSLNSGTLNHKLASLKHYGLAEVETDKITFSSLTNKLLDNKNVSKDAFLFPDVFRELYTSLEKNSPIKTSDLEEIAVNQLGIAPTGQKKFTKNFIKSGMYAGLVKYNEFNRNEVLILNDASQEKVIDNTQPTDASQKAELSLSKGKATIFVPENLSETDKKRLKTQIDIF